jgi:hypothetical protein
VLAGGDRRVWLPGALAVTTLVAPKRKSLARSNKTRMGCPASKTLLEILIAWPLEMPTPQKRSYSARVAS